VVPYQISALEFSRWLDANFDEREDDERSIEVVFEGSLYQGKKTAKGGRRRAMTGQSPPLTGRRGGEEGDRILIRFKDAVEESSRASSPRAPEPQPAFATI
jgi:hypothetical protein